MQLIATICNIIFLLMMAISLAVRFSDDERGRTGAQEVMKPLFILFVALYFIRFFYLLLIGVNPISMSDGDFGIKYLFVIVLSVILLIIIKVRNYKKGFY